jgi:tetraacyldisaccharide 4'-kinase
LVETTHRPLDLQDSDGNSNPLDDLRGSPIAAFCGIGNPQAFRHTLRDLGADLRDFRVFPDHHRYDRGDVESLRGWAAALPPEVLVVTTQKDLVKIRLIRLADRPLAALRVRLHVGAGQDLLHRHLDAVLPR